ncbi:glycerate kinase type-2 family protein [Haloarcula amylolytica]|uniref:glycerate kinase type-2 family protein n=1 Tax=Haloarcula amylolytica TaxID=396317 RepID=UPI003C74CE54
MIRNRSALADSPAHEVALDCLEAAVDAAAPAVATKSAIERGSETLTIGETAYDLDNYSDIVIVGGGKATGGVTRALESILGDALSGGHVVVKQTVDTETVRSSVGDHPLPSDRNVEATADMLETVDEADEDTLVLFVLTGGASALLSAPAGELTLKDLQTTTDRLLSGGVPIEEINAVRKHLSDLKGGQIARRAAPATVAGLLISDVVGNDLSTIGSGPSAPDETTYEDALGVFERHDLTPPPAVRAHLEAGRDGRISETPFPDDSAFDRVTNHLIGDNATALDAAAAVAEEAGYEPLVLTSRLRGEAREVAKSLVAIAEEATATGTPVKPPAVLLAGGETTVTVTGDGGQGGPNQEFVLSGALDHDGDAVIAAIDTDGEDGSSDVAGAIADGTVVDDRERARDALLANDAGSYLSEIEATVETGPTGTNVNDVAVIVVRDGNE